MEYTPRDESLRERFIDILGNLYSEASHFPEILEFSDIKKNRKLEEALEEIDTFTQFMPDSFVLHSDWGIGRVTDLNMLRKKVTINFQRKRNHQMDISLAKNIVTRLEPGDFRISLVTNKEELKRLATEKPVQLIRVVLKSYGGTLSAKDIKEKLSPTIIAEKEWTNWWSKTNSELRRDPYVSVSSGSAKTYSLKEQATSDEDQLLIRFDEAKFPRDKVDMIYEYLRTTKRGDIHEAVIKQFSKRIHAITPKRQSQVEQIELWYTNEDLKEYIPSLESLPIELIDKTLEDPQKSIGILKRLRIRNHELRYIERFQQIHPEGWVEAFKQKLLEEDIQARDEIAEYLIRADHLEIVISTADTALSDYRKYPQPFIWLARKTLLGECDWLEGKTLKSSIIERLLVLTDYLTSQAKRRDKDEAAWLRKVAADAREIIRRNHYALVKKHIQDADESLAQSIYRRAQTNEGLDARTSADLTTIIRARFPSLFAHAKVEESLLPEGLYCLKESYTIKQALLKRLVEIELPTVVKEIETARGLGDLRENAEYHAAKDKQKLLASQTAELQDMLQKARAIDLSEVNTEQIAFGTKFFIKPVGSEAQEGYMMLGPWESDPDNGILSYQAPFAACFMAKKTGEIINVDLPRHTGRYEISTITQIPEEEIQIILKRIETNASKMVDISNVPAEVFTSYAESPESPKPAVTEEEPLQEEPAAPGEGE